MVATLAQPKTLTFLEFLEKEQKSNVKHEFHKGKLKEMAGGTQRHSEITSNIGAFLNIYVLRKNKAFHVFGSDLMIYVESIDKSLYPDISVVEGIALGINGTTCTITNPKLIVEVLSPSTQAYDKGDKFDNYRLLPSLREYILVYPDEPKIDCYYLKDPSKNVWSFHQIVGIEASIKFQSIGCTIKLKNMYDNLPPIGT
jgi:Uma2 family endonuclease